MQLVGLGSKANGIRPRLVVLLCTFIVNHTVTVGNCDSDANGENSVWAHTS